MKSLVAAAQMTSTGNKLENLQKAEYLIDLAALKGAQLLSLPENFAFFGTGDCETVKQAEPLAGPSITRLKHCAKKNHIWLSLGGFQEQIPDTDQVYNSHLIIDDQGDLKAVYRKIHLFSAQLPDGSIYEEGRIIKSSNQPVMLSTPWFKAGLGICFDLRFGNLFNFYSEKGAQVLLLPAAFTKFTGEAHWEVLLRARAIENQCYVVAAAQIGQNNHKRQTFGHAMIVDPWGQILAMCQEKDELAMAEIDIERVNNIRRQMPLRRKVLTDESIK